MSIIMLFLQHGMAAVVKSIYMILKKKRAIAFHHLANGFHMAMEEAPIFPARLALIETTFIGKCIITSNIPSR